MNQQEINKDLDSQNKVIASLERYMEYDRDETVIILEDFELRYTKAELAHIKDLWLEGLSVPQIAETLNRDENELFLAVFHLSLKNDSRKTKKNDNIKMTVSQINGRGT